MSDAKIIAATIVRRTLGHHLVFKYADVFNGIHDDSFQ